MLSLADIFGLSRQNMKPVEVRFRTEPLTAEQGWPLSCNKNGFSVSRFGARVGLR